MLKDVEQASLQRLLELQAEDSAIQRLEHKRATLPEAQRLAELNEQLSELDADLAIARKQQEDAAREQDKIEGEIGLLDQKIEREENRLFGGAVSNPKELGALQSEIAMLKRKRGEMEDALLEVMVTRDQADGTAASLEEERVRTAQQTEELSVTVAGLTGDIESELKQHNATRDEVTKDIPEGLLNLYESIRQQKHGVGAAALRAGTCEGCHTKVPAVEIEEMKSSGGLHRCENCRRILVVV